MSTSPPHPPPLHRHSAKELADKSGSAGVSLGIRVRRLATAVGLDRERRLLVIAAITGILVALVALGFILPIHWAERQISHFGAEDAFTRMLLVGALPILGAMLCGVVLRMIPVQVKAHGISSVLYAIHRKRAHLPMMLAVRTWIGASATIISGGSAGPEGPIVTIGSTLASGLGRFLRLDPARITMLLGCGSAAGIAAVFNAPLTGIFFTLEVILRELSLRSFIPIVIAAVFAAATVQSVLGSSTPLFGSAAELAMLQPTMMNIAALPALALLGVVCGAVSVAFIRALQSTEHAFAQFRAPPMWKPALGAGLLVCMGIGYALFASEAMPNLQSDTAQSPSLTPPFYGTGYSVARSAMNPLFYESGQFATLALLLLVLVVLKLLATCVTLGSGSIGGLFAPSLLIGALLGGSFGACVTDLPVIGAIAPATCALAGMAGVVAATTHAPLAGAMLVYELTQEPRVLLPVVLVAALATVTCRMFERHSLYTAELAALGVRLGSPADATALRQLRVHDAGLVEACTVQPSEGAQRLVELSQSTRHEHFVAVTPGGAFRGVVSAQDLKFALMHSASLPALSVSDLFAQRVKPLRRDESLEHAVDAFSHTEVDSLPVVDHAGIFLGLVTRKSVMRCWRKALERDA